MRPLTCSCAQKILLSLNFAIRARLSIVLCAACADFILPARAGNLHDEELAVSAIFKAFSGKTR